MSEDTQVNALETALTEIRNTCPEITRSFIFTKEGTIIAEAAQDAEIYTEKTFRSLQNLMEKTDTIGGLNTFLVNGDKGVVQISRINNMYLALSAPKKADMTYIQSIARTTILTIMKILQNTISTVSTPLKPASYSENLTAENLTGLFTGDTAQVDNEILKEWSKSLNNTRINEIEIETSDGKIARCKVKAISEPEFKGKGIVRIPEKIYRTLEVEKGDQVKVKPRIPEGK